MLLLVLLATNTMLLLVQLPAWLREILLLHKGRLLLLMMMLMLVWMLPTPAPTPPPPPPRTPHTPSPASQPTLALYSLKCEQEPTLVISVQRTTTCCYTFFTLISPLTNHSIQTLLPMLRCLLLRFSHHAHPTTSPSTI
jgi:cytochrome b561